jgi:lipopolysaccharide export LptBFGC system permease protein LptF
VTDASLPIPSARPATAFQFRSYLAGFVKGGFAWRFFKDMAIFTAAIIILIEAIFLAEHFTWVFRDAVRHDANLFNISLVLACTGTGIFDLALATAVLIAAYMTLLRMRENREFLALFASGLGPYQLGALVLVVSVIALLTGIAGGGIVDPLSRYAQRSILFSTELQSLKKGLARGEFYDFPNYVVYAADHPAKPQMPGVDMIDASGAPPATNRTLFIYQQIAPHTSRVITAAQASLSGPDRSGQVILDLNDFSSHTFADAHPLVGLSRAETSNAAILSALKEVPQITMHVRDMSRLMMVNQLLPFGTRGSDGAEQTIFEQLAKDDSATPALRAAQMRLLAERFARGLLSFLAPLLALAAVSLTTPRSNWFALPLVCLALMSVNLGSEWLITTVSPMGVATALLPPLLFCLAVAGLSGWIAVRRQGELVRPQLARA